MADTRTRSWQLVVLIVLAHIVFIAAFVGERWVQKTIVTEREMNIAFYSESASAAAEARGEAWFRSLFVDSGAMEVIFRALLPTEQDNRPSQGTQGIATNVFTWWEERIRAWWTLLFAAFLRLGHLALWWPYALFFVAPFIIDGVVQRMRAKHSFRFASPVRHRISVLALEFVVMAYLVLLLLPMAMTPLLTPALIVLTGIAAAGAVQSFVKRV